MRLVAIVVMPVLLLFAGHCHCPENKGPKHILPDTLSFTVHYPGNAWFDNGQFLVTCACISPG